MTDANTLAQRILDHYDDMPRGERRLADVLIERPTAIVEQSATGLAELAGISKATTARFFRRLGYRNFKSAQREARSMRAGGPPENRRDRFVQKVNFTSSMGSHVQSDVQNLVRTFEEQRSDLLRQAVDILGHCQKVWVVGFGDNYPLAHFARALLIRVRPDIRMVPIGGFSVPEEFASITPDDAMLAFGIGRRTRSLRNIMRSGVAAGVNVIFVTDQTGYASPDHATLTLRCRTRAAGLFDSFAAPASLMTFLCSSLALKLGETALNRLESIDVIHEEWDDMIGNDL